MTPDSFVEAEFKSDESDEDGGRDSTQKTGIDEVEDDNDVGSPSGEARLVAAFIERRPSFEGRCISLAEANELTIKNGQDWSVVRRGRAITAKICDKTISYPHAVLRSLPGGWEVEDLGSKNGTRVNGDRFQRTPLFDGDVIGLGWTQFIFRTIGSGGTATLGREEGESAVEMPSDTPVAFRTLMSDLERRFVDLAEVAQSPVAVLLRGETGTGKGMVARAIHELSGRRGPFVVVNCGAVARELIETELFGHQRGAFSGATKEREGYVRAAQGGTLFLDEIGDLPVERQAALLHVLQEREVMPVGSTRPVTVDIRVIAATHQPLDELIRERKFRQDLYARLTGYQFGLPHLRERMDDIGILMGAILKKMGSRASAVTFSRPAARALLVYNYPGNIRELEQAVEAAAVLTRYGEKGSIQLGNLPETIRNYRLRIKPNLRPEDKELYTLLVGHLWATQGNVSAVARIMKRQPKQIHRWCRRFSIDLGKFRPPKARD